MRLTVGPGRLAQMQKHGWRNNLKALTTFILSLFLCAECGSVCFAERLLLAGSGHSLAPFTEWRKGGAD